MDFNHRRRARAAADRLKRQRARPGKEIDRVLAARLFAQEIEHGLANSVLHRPNAPVAGVFEFRAAKDAADYAKARGIPAKARLAPDVAVPLRTLRRVRVLTVRARVPRLFLVFARLRSAAALLRSERIAAALLKALGPLVPQVRFRIAKRVERLARIRLVRGRAKTFVDLRARKIRRNRYVVGILIKIVPIFAAILA